MTKAPDDWAFILVAAGSGSRIGGEPKQFRELGGRPVWTWSARVAASLRERGVIREVVAVFPPGMTPEIPPDLGCALIVAEGGSTRSESVINGLRAASADYVLIHDAARPFLSEDICAELILNTTEHCGAVPLLPSADSLKEFHGERITAIPRDLVFRTQTPQAFKRDVLLGVLEQSEGGASDEAALWLASSRELTRVAGDEQNFKITTNFDWRTARALAEPEWERRVGFGFDVHELVPGRRLILGGVEIDSPLGLLGHSDADIICHAASDALLGAAGEPDIGTLYPAGDERYKDSDSTELLAGVLSLLREKGWRVVWIDVTLAAQVPRMGPWIPEIISNLSRRFLCYDLEGKWNIKVKSGERVGSVGRGECMTAYAAATVERARRL